MICPNVVPLFPFKDSNESVLFGELLWLFYLPYIPYPTSIIFEVFRCLPWHFSHISAKLSTGFEWMEWSNYFHLRLLQLRFSFRARRLWIALRKCIHWLYVFSHIYKYFSQKYLVLFWSFYKVKVPSFLS